MIESTVRFDIPGEWWYEWLSLGHKPFDDGRFTVAQKSISMFVYFHVIASL
jgi:hypothetical protein